MSVDFQFQWYISCYFSILGSICIENLEWPIHWFCSSFTSYLLTPVWIYPESTSVLSCSCLLFDIFTFVHTLSSLSLFFLLYINLEIYYVQRSIILHLLWTSNKTLLFVIIFLSYFSYTLLFFYLVLWSIVLCKVFHF